MVANIEQLSWERRFAIADLLKPAISNRRSLRRSDLDQAPLVEPGIALGNHRICNGAGEVGRAMILTRCITLWTSSRHRDRRTSPENLDFYAGVLRMRLEKKRRNRGRSRNLPPSLRRRRWSSRDRPHLFPEGLVMAPSIEGHGLSSEVSLASPPAAWDF